MKPTEEQKAKLQHFYRASRDLLNCGVVPDWAVQRSFEEAMHGFLDEESWRPTHVSRAAAEAIASGNFRRVQRAHGVLGDRMDRYDRTLQVLRGEEKEFDEWWDFYLHHDSTVLITREEHGSGRSFQEADLIPVPVERGLFLRSGFSFRVRKRQEEAWAREVLSLVK